MPRQTHGGEDVADMGSTASARSGRRRAWRLLAAAGAAIALAVTSGGAVAASWNYEQTDADWCYDAAWMDRDGNGVIDQLWSDLDDDCRWDSRLYNSRGSDALLEVATYDMDENGIPSFRLLDGDQRVGFDYIQADWNQDGRWDVKRIIPGSRIDYATRINRNNASRDLMYLFRWNTGQSLLYPTFTFPY